MCRRKWFLLLEVFAESCVLQYLQIALRVTPEGIVKKMSIWLQQQGEEKKLEERKLKLLLAWSRCIEVVPDFACCLSLLPRLVSGWIFLFAADVFWWNCRDWDTCRRGRLGLGAGNSSYFHFVFSVDNFQVAWVGNFIAWRLGRGGTGSAVPW